MKQLIIGLLFAAATLNTHAQWSEVINAATPPLAHARLIKIAIGSQDDIWSLWNVCIKNCRHALAKWDGTQWNVFSMPFALKEVVDITVTPEGHLYILEDYDRKALQYAQTKNGGRKGLYDLTRDPKYKIPQRLHTFDGSKLRTQDVANTLSSRLNYGTCNNMYLKTYVPGVWYCCNIRLQCEVITPEFTSVISHNDQMYYQQMDSQDNVIRFRTRDGELFYINKESAGIISYDLPWQITQTHLYVVLKTKVLKTIVLAIDLATKDVTSLGYLPCELKTSNGLFSHPQISIGYDGTIWAYSCNNTIFEWKPLS